MKNLLILLFVSASFAPAFSQDTLKMKNGDEKIVQIVEITKSEITFRNPPQDSLKLYLVAKSTVSSISYLDGKEVVFFKNQRHIDETTYAPWNVPGTNRDEMFYKGVADADLYYSRYKDAAAGTLIVSLLSPLVGLIPATACSTSPPKQRLC